MLFFLGAQTCFCKMCVRLSCRNGRDASAHACRLKRHEGGVASPCLCVQASLGLAKKGFVFFFGLEVSLRSFHVFIHLVLGLLDWPIYLGKSCFLCATMVLVFLSHRRRLIDR